MLKKTMEQYVLLALRSADSVTITFDLWMTRSTMDTFILVVNFLDREWMAQHITVSLFKADKTLGAALAEMVKPLLEKFQLTTKVIAYVKDKGSNLDTLTKELSAAVSCKVLNLDSPYNGHCFGSMMSKACSHATKDKKVCKGMKKVSLKTAQVALQSTITWTKKSRKGRLEWDKACIEAELSAKRLRTPVTTRFASRVILFQETLEYTSAINICYRRLSLKLQARVPSGRTWAIARVVTETLNPVVEQCILNQSRGFWLLSDALVAAMVISIKLKAKFNKRDAQNSKPQLGNTDSELDLLYSCMVEAAALVLKPFLGFTTRFELSNAHHMLAIMLDPRFKGLRCISKFVGTIVAKQVVAQYDKEVLLPMLHRAWQITNVQSVQLEVIPEIEEFGKPDDFAVAASPEEATEGLITKDLSLFRRLAIEKEDLEVVHSCGGRPTRQSFQLWAI